MSKIQIFIVYADHCDKCEKLISLVEEVTKNLKIPHEIIKYHFETKVALSICMNNGIDEVPGLVIGNYVAKGDNFTKELIIEAIKNASYRKH